MARAGERRDDLLPRRAPAHRRLRRRARRGRLVQAPGSQAPGLYGGARRGWRLIPTVLNIDPFPRGDFCRQSGARCAAVPDTASDARRRWRQKAPGPYGWGKSARPGAQGAIGRRLPAIWDSGVPHRAARRACPAGRFAAMKRVNINDLWFYCSNTLLKAPTPSIRWASAISAP